METIDVIEIMRQAVVDLEVHGYDTDPMIDAIIAVGSMQDELTRLRRALRSPTTETFAKDVAEYEAKLAEGGAA